MVKGKIVLKDLYQINLSVCQANKLRCQLRHLMRFSVNITAHKASTSIYLTKNNDKKKTLDGFYFSVISRLISASCAFIFYWTEPVKSFVCYNYVFLHVWHARAQLLISDFAIKLQCRYSILMVNVNSCKKSISVLQPLCNSFLEIRGNLTV